MVNDGVTRDYLNINRRVPQGTVMVNVIKLVYSSNKLAKFSNDPTLIVKVNPMAYYTLYSSIKFNFKHKVYSRSVFIRRLCLFEGGVYKKYFEGNTNITFC